MKKTILIIAVMFLLVMGFASASLTNYWNFDADLTDSQGGNDWINETGIIFRSSDNCVIGNCLQWNETNQNLLNLTSSRLLNITTGWTVNFWVNMTSYEGSPESGLIAGSLYGIPSKNHIVFGGIGATEYFYSIINASAGASFNCDGAIIGKKEMITLGHNGTQFYAYRNGAFCGDTDRIGLNFTLQLFGEYRDGYGWNGYLDEMAIWDEVKTPTYISTMYSNYLLGKSPLTTAPVITLVYPENNTHYNNYDGWLNWTTNEKTNCSVNRTEWVENAGKTNSTHYFHFNTNYATLDEGLHYFNITCNDSAMNNASQTYFFGIDVTAPSAESTLDDNNTIWYKGDTLTFQINFTDNLKLFSLNISALDFSNYTANINTTFISFNGSINLDNYSIGLHKINITYADAHTAVSIGDWDYDVDWFTDKLTFDFDGSIFNRQEFSIQPKEWTHFSGVEVIKEKDRYIFDFERDKSYLTTAEVFIVKSTDKIHIIGDDTYTGWLVIEGLNKWIDFETQEGYKATVKRISNYEVEVTSKGSLFHSTGDLNVVSEVYDYYVFNYTVSYESSVLEGNDAEFKLAINITGSDITTSTGILVYDSKGYSTTKQEDSYWINFTRTHTSPFISSESENIEFYFNFTLNSFEYNTSDFNQTVNQIYIDDCGGKTNMSTLNFTVFNELNNNNLTAEFLAYFKIYEDTPLIYRNQSFNFSEAHSHTICIYPTWATYYTDFITEYSKAGYTTRNYIARNYTLNNITDTIKLFLLNTGNSTSVYVNTRDAIDDPIPNILVEMWNFNLQTGNYSLVESKITNTEGKGIFNLVYEDRFYKFKFYEDTKLVKETDKFQITDLDLYFWLFDTAKTGLERWLEIRDFQTLFSYDNDTRKLSLTYGVFPPDVTTIYMDILYNNNTVLNSQSNTTESGRFTYVFPTGNYTYTATTYIEDSFGDSFTVDTYSVDLTVSLWKMNPREGLALAFIVFCTIALIACFSPIGAVVGSVLGLIIVSLFGLIPMLKTQLFGIVAFAIILIVIMMKRYRQ